MVGGDSGKQHCHLSLSEIPWDAPFDRYINMEVVCSIIISNQMLAPMFL